MKKDRMNIVYNQLVSQVCMFASNYKMQILFLIIYKIIVDIIYLVCIGRRSEFGIIISFPDIISGYIFVILSSFFWKFFLKTEVTSNIILIVIYMTYFIPITTYCGWGAGSSGLQFFMILFAVIISVLQVKLPLCVVAEGNKVKKERLLSVVFYLLFITVSILTVYIWAHYTDFRIITNLNDVYIYRAEAQNYSMPGWMVYLQSLSKILIPILILIAFVRKKIVFALFGLFLLILNFSYAGHKSVFFMGIIILVGYLLWRKGMICFFLPGGCIIGLVGLIEYIFTDHQYVISYFFRRQGYVLAQLSDYYYRFFENNPTDIFRSTFLGKLGFDSPYSIPIPYVIGNNYSTQTVSCNNGLLADVWSHLGVIGIIIIPVILIVCLRLFDAVTDGISMRYVVGMAVYYAVVFSNTTWSTVLLTHGFLIMCLAFFVFPRSDEAKREGKL